MGGIPAGTEQILPETTVAFGAAAAGTSITGIVSTAGGPEIGAVKFLGNQPRQRTVFSRWSAGTVLLANSHAGCQQHTEQSLQSQTDRWVLPHFPTSDCFPAQPPPGPPPAGSRVQDQPADSLPFFAAGIPCLRHHPFRTASLRQKARGTSPVSETSVRTPIAERTIVSLEALTP